MTQCLQTRSFQRVTGIRIIHETACILSFFVFQKRARILHSGTQSTSRFRTAHFRSQPRHSVVARPHLATEEAPAHTHPTGAKRRLWPRCRELFPARAVEGSGQHLGSSSPAAQPLHRGVCVLGHAHEQAGAGLFAQHRGSNRQVGTAIRQKDERTPWGVDRRWPHSAEDRTAAKGTRPRPVGVRTGNTQRHSE